MDVPCSCIPVQQVQRKRTLEFPMDHSLHDAHRFFQERRVTLAKQHQNLISKNGESKQLISYSRKRFETALIIKGEEPLPPPSPEERTLFWDNMNPSWSYRRHLSMSAKPVSKPIELSPRPGSGPPCGIAVAEGQGGRGSGSPRPAFNHLRGNNSAYPTIRRLLLESNAEYRVVCPTAGDCNNYDRCRRPSTDCSSKSDFLLIPLEDDIEAEEEKKEGEDDVHGVNEAQLQEEMLRMATAEEAESVLEMNFYSTGEIQREEKTSIPKSESSHKGRHSKEKNSDIVKNDDDDKKDDDAAEDDEDNPASPWHCWVDDATVSSIGSKKSDLEVHIAEVSSPLSPAPEEVVESPQAHVPETQVIPVPSSKSLGKKSTTSIGKKAGSHSQDNLLRKSSKAKNKGGKPSVSEHVEEIIGLPPPPPPPVVEEVVKEVEVEEEPPEPVLPSYICPSSVIKSTQAEIKLWLHKSTFSSANRLLPIY